MTETPLLLAISRRDSALVGMLLAAGADPNHAARGAAPLLVAMQIGYAPVVRQLVVAGANPDVRDRRTGWTPLTWALHRNDSTLAALLQGAGADPNAVPDHALLKAVEAGDLDALRRALAAGASPAAQTERGQPAIVVAAGNGHEAMVFALLDAGARVPPDQGGAMLYTAAFHGADSVVKYLLSAGIAVTPHHLGAAAAGGQEVTVRVLLEAGADPNGEYGHPLREAIRGRNADVVSLLVSAGADVTFTTNRGMDPLAYAVQSGQADAVRVLLEAGADATRARATPLMMTALYSGDTLLMGTLLDRGAPIDARDTRGQTALDAARRMTYRPELAAYLERQVAVRGTGGKEP